MPSLLNGLERYDVVIIDKVEVFDSYWLEVNINKEYKICARHHDITGLIIRSENKKSNATTTEIVQYLDQLIFNTKTLMKMAKIIMKRRTLRSRQILYNKPLFFRK